MAIYQFENRLPEIDSSCFVADTAAVIGSVTLGTQTSVWFSAVIRGDNEPISIGANSNVQEGAVLHTDPGFPCQIAEGVTIGHQAMLHGCIVGSNSLIGIQAVILNGAHIGQDCLIGAGALVTEGKQIPDRSLVLGSPGKVIRTLTDEEVERIRRNAQVYVLKANAFRQQLIKIG